MKRESTQRILFIGDITGEEALSALERQLPLWRARWQPDFTVANAENLALTGAAASSGFGMTPGGLARLFDLGVDLVTGGNHSWDGPHAAEVHQDERVLRPLNYLAHAPGRGAARVVRAGFCLGVINLVSRTALAQADAPLDALDAQLRCWGDSVDAVLVDFHGESVDREAEPGLCGGRSGGGSAGHAHTCADPGHARLAGRHRLRLRRRHDRSQRRASGHRAGRFCSVAANPPACHAAHTSGDWPC